MSYIITIPEVAAVKIIYTNNFQIEWDCLKETACSVNVALLLCSLYLSVGNIKTDLFCFPSHFRLNSAFSMGVSEKQMQVL